MIFPRLRFWPVKCLSTSLESFALWKFDRFGMGCTVKPIAVSPRHFFASSAAFSSAQSRSECGEVLMDRHQVIRFAPGLWEPFRQKLSKESEFSSLSTGQLALHRGIDGYVSLLSSTHGVPRTRSHRLCRKRTEQRQRFSLGSTTPPLVVKLVKPIKILCSRSRQARFGSHQLLIPGEAQMGTADASTFLWKANSAMRGQPASICSTAVSTSCANSRRYNTH